MSGYVYSSCGFGESTQDVVYGGNALIYENGVLLAEGERFSLTPQLVVSQIDVERLRVERSNNTTFVNAQRQGIMNGSEVWCHGIDVKTDFCLERTIDPCPFIPQDDGLTTSCEEIFNIQVLGLAKRLVHTGCKHVVLGISGGLDSTLALLVCIRTFADGSQGNHWGHDAWLWNNRSHLSECNSINGKPEDHNSRNPDSQECHAAF